MLTLTLTLIAFTAEYITLPEASLVSLPNSNSLSANFKFYNGFNATIISPSPITLAMDNSTGIAYGLFDIDNTTYLESSSNFVDWTVINTNVIPSGYELDYAMDLAALSSGALVVSATKQIGNNNFTVFMASWDGGKTFSTVLNVSLLSPTVRQPDGSIYNAGPGHGFWHGIAETTNGTLFAGLYDPEGLIYRSSDDAHTWSLVFNASAAGFGWQNEIHDVEVDPYTNYIYVITDDEANVANLNRTIWLSTDYGSTWKLLWGQDLNPPGSGLTSSYVPLAFGFLDAGKVAALGLDSKTTRYLYLFHANSDGTLSEYMRLNASSSFTDPFYTNWLQTFNSTSILWATRDSIYSVNSSALGAGLLIASSSGIIEPLAIVQNVNLGQPSDLGFEDVIGPAHNGAYGSIARTVNGFYLFTFNLTSASSSPQSTMTTSSSQSTMTTSSSSSSQSTMTTSSSQSTTSFFKNSTQELPAYLTVGGVVAALLVIGASFSILLRRRSTK